MANSTITTRCIVATICRQFPQGMMYLSQLAGLLQLPQATPGDLEQRTHQVKHTAETHVACTNALQHSKATTRQKTVSPTNNPCMNAAKMVTQLAKAQGYNRTSYESRICAICCTVQSDLYHIQRCALRLCTLSNKP